MSEEVTTQEVGLDDIVSVYLKIRGERDRLKHEYESKDLELKAEMAQIEEVLLSQCNQINADSIKTSQGTIIKTLRENFICNDWENLKAFIVENNLIDLMQQRLHSGNLKEYLVTHGNDGLPPGVTSIREYSIVVKKPSKS